MATDTRNLKGTTMTTLQSNTTRRERNTIEAWVMRDATRLCGKCGYEYRGVKNITTEGYEVLFFDGVGYRRQVVAFEPTLHSNDWFGHWYTFGPFTSKFYKTRSAAATQARSHYNRGLSWQGLKHWAGVSSK